MNNKWLFFGVPFLALLGYQAYTLSQPQPIDFSLQIKPLINKNCIACHGGVKRAGGLSLLFREDALAPTESGKPAIVPFRPEASEFIKRLHHTDPEERMPYKAAPLNKEDIALLTQWVKEGANWGNHWAYLPIEKPQVPNNGLFASLFSFFGSSWANNEIDNFVEKNLDTENLSPQPEAEPEILKRRVSFDLIGLPNIPTNQKATPHNYESYVDSLLASPAFGERWASVWLDLARYSDSRGYQKDNGRNIWKYRDWVIKALNADMPFDQFSREQLAGDLLPNPSKDQLLATAFHRNSMNNDETGTVDEEFRVAAVLDRINTTWEVWQGTTFACVQCHSHPYDPFRHEEYYKFMAFFNNSRDEDTQDEAPFLREFNPNDQTRLDSLHRASIGVANAHTWLSFVKHLEPRFHAHYADRYTKGALLGDRNIGVFNGGTCRLPKLKLDGVGVFLMLYQNKNIGGRFELRKGSPTGEVIGSYQCDTTEGKGNVLKMITLKPQTGRHDVYITAHNTKIDPNKEVFTINWFSLMPSLQPSMIKAILPLIAAKTDNTPIMQECVAEYSRPTKVFVRGNWLVHGQQVSANVPKSLPSMAQYPKNRLGLANWLVSKQNPLTARVMVNRVWEQLFGYGLVETLEDFGTQGAKPSNAELLDFLAIKYRDDFGWSLKKLVRYMVLSATYRQSSVVTKELVERDPQNRLLARGPRVRLTAEMVRDQALAVSGLLSPKMYGKPVLPFQPEGIWQAVNSSLNYTQSEGEDNYRRAIYTFARRTGPYPSAFTFDAGSRELCLSRRIRTNTPLQALTLLNDPVFVEASIALAKQALQTSPNPEAQISHAYEQVTQKSINRHTRKALLALYLDALSSFQKDPKSVKLFLKTSNKPNLAALSITTNAILNLDEVLVRE